MEINGKLLEMLWDSGASVTVMSGRLWRKIGAPMLDESAIQLCGVFSTKAEKPMGRTTVEMLWKMKRRQIEITIVRNIYPDFIGGINVMHSFGIRLAEINSIDAELLNQKHTDSERIRRALEYCGNNQTVEITNLIKNFGSIFMASKFDLGFTSLVKHEMIIKGTPIMQPPRRQPMHMEKKIESLLEELIAAKVIRRCTSPWNAPLVIVGKKDGSIRMCVDYRGLNSITEKESFPMPNSRFLLDCLAGAKHFSSIDLGQAYYQVEVDNSVQKLTAFSTREGQYCFNRLPFGLATAPATFQRLMHVLLKGLIFKGVVVYLDDILVYGENAEEHNQRLEEVFTRIKTAGLKINPEKCVFNKKELAFRPYCQWKWYTNKQKENRTNSDGSTSKMFKAVAVIPWLNKLLQKIYQGLCEDCSTPSRRDIRLRKSYKLVNRVRREFQFAKKETMRGTDFRLSERKQKFYLRHGC